MAYSNLSFYPQSIRTLDAQTWVNADGTTLKTISTAGANGSKIEMLTASSTDTANMTMQLWLTVGGTDYLLGSVSVPLNSGNTSAVASVDLLRSTNLTVFPTDSCGNKFLRMPPNSILKAGVLVAVTAAKTVTVLSEGEDY